jgi:outer membrane immunogenic protein
MRSLLLAGVTVVGLGITLPAQAADMTVKAPVAPPPAVLNWSGFYVGLHAGATSRSEGVDYVLQDPSGGAPFTSRSFSFCGVPAGVNVPVPQPNPFDLRTTCSDTVGFIAGAQIGYNWQIDKWVVGGEADISWRKLEDHFFGVFGSNPTFGLPMGSQPGDTVFMRTKQGTLGTVRARIGYAPSNWMVYATGGLAIGKVQHQVTEVLSPGPNCVFGCRTVADSSTHVGWTVGAGVELGVTRNVSIVAEYLYVDLGDTTLTLAPTSGFFRNTSTTTFHDRSHIVRAKLNWGFGTMPIWAND